MPVYKYERVTASGTKYVPCRGCGRTLRRSTTFEQTISPFNKNDDGTLKTKEQIKAELDAEFRAWLPKNDICRPCSTEITNPLYRRIGEGR